MSRLRELHDTGLSIWLDDLSRDLLDSGDLASLVAHWNITGATSNPTIFARAITASERYDSQLRDAVAAGVRDSQQLFFELALTDVARAADLLYPTYVASGGQDGFVSFECTPDLAHDTAGTIAQAWQLWQRLNRPNVMIKVPATDAGVPAIAELTARGVNVNVTLLFSVGRYGQVVDAYLDGLERRRCGGEQIGDVTSVASFFVSRVDAKTDPVLPPGSAARGGVGIANAARAYATYRQRFTGQRWSRLHRAGARLQRPLWASTGVKSPDYADVHYLENLIAPDAIITAPKATLQAFADHGSTERVLMGEAAADQLLSRAAHAGVDLDAVTTGLEREGVDAFCESYRQLLRRIHDTTSLLSRQPAPA
jgi:transaldolase